MDSSNLKLRPETKYLLCLALMTAAVYVFPAGRAIHDDGDALYAHVAQQMLDRGDWITPHANGVRFLDKPPLLYWLMAVSFYLFGEREWAARVPAALAVFGTGWLLFRIGKRSGNLSGGITAALAFVLSAGTFLFTLEAFPDILLVFFISLALSCFLRWYLGEGKEHWPVFGFFAGLAGAFMAKGMIGVVFPVAIAGLFLLSSKERHVLRMPTTLIGTGFLLFLALVLPWHLMVEWRNPGFFQHYFINEQVLRFLGKRQPVDYSSIPLPLFWALILVWFFPWSVFLPLFWKERKVMSGTDLRTAAIARLSFYWAGVVLAFFSFSSRIEHYSFPVLPPLAILVGIALFHAPGRQSESSRKSVDRTFAALATLGMFTALAAVAACVWYKVGGAALLANPAFTRHTQAYTYYFSPLFHLPIPIRLALMKPFIGTLVTFSLGMLVAWWSNKRGRRLGGVIILALMMIVFSFLALHSLELCEGIISSRPFGVFLAQLHQKGDSLIIMGDYETANSISFYAPIPLLVYQGSAASLEYGLHYPDAPHMILSRQDLESLWEGEERTFLLVPDSQSQDLGLSPSFAVFACSGRTLFCNKPPVAGAKVAGAGADGARRADTAGSSSVRAGDGCRGQPATPMVVSGSGKRQKPIQKDLIQSMLERRLETASKFMGYQALRTFEAENSRFSLRAKLVVKTKVGSDGRAELKTVSFEGSELIRKHVFDKILELDRA